jgi:pilus assembly protein CpaB
MLILMAAGCGLIATIGISQIMERGNPPPANTGEMEPIFVALSDLNVNDLLTAQVLKLEEWPKGKVPAGALTKLEQIEGKRCKQRLYAGEPILAGKVRGADDDTLPSDGIPKGFRVVNVRTDSVSGTGLIVPGDRVDVLVFLNKNTGTGVSATSARTILQDIKIYAVDSTFVGKQEHDGQLVTGKTISLLVTPQQAEKVTLASEMGSIRLIIRSPEDNAEAPTEGAFVADIVGGGAEKNFREQEQRPADDGKGLKDWMNQQQPAVAPVPPLPVEAPPPPWKMVVLEGSTVREMSFPQDDEPPAATSVADPAAAQPAASGSPPAETPQEPKN